MFQKHIVHADLVIIAITATLQTHDIVRRFTPIYSLVLLIIIMAAHNLYQNQTMTLTDKANVDGVVNILNFQREHDDLS